MGLRDGGGRLTKLFDELLVLVEVLQALCVLEVQTHGGRLLAVVSITEHADLHLGPGDVRQLDVSSETLVFLRVVVLQANLELNGLEELALLLLSPLHHLRDALAHVVIGNLGHPANTLTLRQLLEGCCPWMGLTRV